MEKNKKNQRNHYLRFQLKNIKPWTSSHVLFMKNLFSGDKSRSQIKLYYHPGRWYYSAQGKKKKISEINLKTVRERKIYEKYSEFIKLEL